MEIKLYQYGGGLCSFEEKIIRDILRADSSEGQREEFLRVMGILKGFSFGGDENSLSVDLGKVLSDGVITAEKTRALPILLAAAEQCGALELLQPEIMRTMSFYANTQSAVLEIHYRSLVSLKRLSEAVCDGLYRNMGRGFSAGCADEAARGIIAVLPREALSLDNKSDLRLLRNAVRGIEAIASRCLEGGNVERLEDFVREVQPLLKRLERLEEEDWDKP